MLILQGGHFIQILHFCILHFCRNLSMPWTYWKLSLIPNRVKSRHWRKSAGEKVQKYSQILTLSESAE